MDEKVSKKWNIFLAMEEVENVKSLKHSKPGI